MKATDNKKRTNESGSKTPVPAKKAKSATPQKTGEHLLACFIESPMVFC